MLRKANLHSPDTNMFSWSQQTDEVSRYIDCSCGTESKWSGNVVIELKNELSLLRKSILIQFLN